MSLSAKSQAEISRWADHIESNTVSDLEPDDEEILKAAAGEIDLFKDYSSIQTLAQTIKDKIAANASEPTTGLLAHDRKDSSDTAEMEKEIKHTSAQLMKDQLSPLPETTDTPQPDTNKSVPSLSEDGFAKPTRETREDGVSYASHRETADLREKLESLEEIICQLQAGRERDITHRKNIQIQINQILREMKSFDSSLLKINSTLNSSLTKFLSQVHTSLEAVSSGTHVKKLNDQIEASYLNLNSQIENSSTIVSNSKASEKSELKEKLSRIRKLNKM